MDDPWGNAWGETHKTTAESQFKDALPWETPNISYAPPKLDEVDLGTQSWIPPAVSVKWQDEEVPSAATPAWADVSLPDSVSLAPAAVPSWGASWGAAAVDSEDDVEQPPNPETVVEDTEKAEFPSPLQSPSNALGTFESGSPPSNIESNNSWQSPPILVEEDAWGSPWGQGESIIKTATSDDSLDNKRSSVAPGREQKISVEGLNSLIKQWEDLASELWQGFEPVTEKRRIDSRSEWQGGLQNVEGLTILVRRILAEDQPLPKIQFSQTNVSKSLHTALRLTKSFPLSQSSPLSNFYASKGSTAWERAVKARKEKSRFDLGWTTGLAELEDVPEKKPEVKGLLSFWGRRVSTPLMERKASPSPASLPKSSSPSSSPVSSPITPTTLPVPTSPLPATTTDTPDTTSAVSRFLNKFSRTKGTSPRSSLSLSQSDISFLDEPAPSANQDSINGDDPFNLLVESSPSGGTSANFSPPVISPPPSQINYDSILNNGSSSKLFESSLSRLRETRPPTTNKPAWDETKGLLYDPPQPHVNKTLLETRHLSTGAKINDSQDELDFISGTKPGIKVQAAVSSRFSMPSGFSPIPSLPSFSRTTVLQPDNTSKPTLGMDKLDDLDDLFSTAQRQSTSYSINNSLDFDSSFGSFVSPDLLRPTEKRRPSEPPTPPVKSPPVMKSTTSHLNPMVKPAPLSKDKPRPTIARMSQAVTASGQSTASVPVILPPPPGFRPPLNGQSKKQDDLLGFGDITDLQMRSQDPALVRGPFGFGNGSPVSLPPTQSRPLVSMPPLPASTPPIAPARSTPPILSPPGKKGLSAQDLSFFEGL